MAFKPMGEPSMAEPRSYRPRDSVITAIRVAVDNQEVVAEWCKGSIKGTRLPMQERCIDFWDSVYELQHRAEVGDWVVKSAFSGAFFALSDDGFRAQFEEVQS